MFKRKGSKFAPATPKINSISLPDELYTNPSVEHRKTAKPHHDHTSTTYTTQQWYEPHNIPTRQRMQSCPGNPVDKPRVPPKPILYQSKTFPMDNYHATSHPTVSASRYHEPKLTKCQDPHDDYDDKPEKSKRYIKVTEAPLKAEAIALSWPLLDNNTPRRNRYPALYFDIGIDPSIPSNLMLWRGGYKTKITPAEREIPVSTHCVVTEMTILCDGLGWWPVRIHRNEGIRCIDVFTAIYQNFHTKLTDGERRALDPHGRCIPAFHQRCKESPGIDAYNIKQGMMRVDLLRGRRLFGGIKQSGHEWILSIDRGDS